MKRALRPILFAAGIIFAARSPAQPDATNVPPAQPTNGVPAGTEHARFHRKDGMPMDGAFLDQWLGMLKQRNPEEFEQMKKLRDENPDEFHRKLRQKLQDLRLGGLRDHPQVAEAFKNLSPEDREWVTQRLQQPTGPGNGNDQHGGGFAGWKRPSPEFTAAEQKARDLAKKYREAKTDDEKAAAKKDLRATVSNLFDLREKDRAADIKQIEDHLAKIKKQLDDHQAKRTDIIDGRLKDIISGDSTKSAPE